MFKGNSEFSTTFSLAERKAVEVLERKYGNGTLPKTNIFAPEKMVVGKLLSIWETIFSCAMLVSGRVNKNNMLSCFVVFLYCYYEGVVE